MIIFKNAEVIKKYTFKKASYLCEICNGRGDKWPVECHEVWNYDDKKHIQTLERTIALCPSCHQVKHFGLASISGNYEKALKHFININHISYKKAIDYIEKSFSVYEQRSKYDWTLNIDWLNANFNCNISSKRQ